MGIRGQCKPAIACLIEKMESEKKSGRLDEGRCHYVAATEYIVHHYLERVSLKFSD